MAVPFDDVVPLPFDDNNPIDDAVDVQNDDDEEEQDDVDANDVEICLVVDGIYLISVVVCWWWFCCCCCSCCCCCFECSLLLSSNSAGSNLRFFGCCLGMAAHANVVEVVAWSRPS